MTIILTKILIFFLARKGRGSSLPGKFALKLSPQILSKVARGYKLVLVTGTNGKTTTSSMITNVISQAGHHVINNTSGANMTPGIVTMFIKNYRFFKKVHPKYAVIEVDEAYLREITMMLTPTYIVLLNVFRDQLDRFGETTTTYQFILEGIKNAPQAKLIVNGDEPMFGHMPVENEVAYFGFDHYQPTHIEANTESLFCRDCKAKYHYESVVFNHHGHYKCPDCGHARPALDYSITDIDLTVDGSILKVGDTSFSVAVPGLYNAYNALAAIALGKGLGIHDATIQTALASGSSKFGRFERIKIDDKEARLLLIKNPAGCNQCIETVTRDASPVSLVFLLNDKHADGRDVSWIYDAAFEKLQKMHIVDLIIGGDRAYDMAVRLKVAGLDETCFVVCEDESDILGAMKNQSENLYVFMTYTAMTSFRNFLVEKGYAAKLSG